MIPSCRHHDDIERLPRADKLYHGRCRYCLRERTWPLSPTEKWEVAMVAKALRGSVAQKLRAERVA